MQRTLNCRRWGKVKIYPMKFPNMLKAYSSLQAHSKNLRLYAKIGLSEQGKVSDDSKLAKKNKQLN